MIPKRIVAIGTSAFFGTGDIIGKGGYIGRLKEWHESANEDNELYNLGISREGAGETTAELLKRLTMEAPVRQPHLIFLTSGINDIRHPEKRENPPVVSQENFQKNIHEMIANARQIAKDVIFVSTAPIKEKHDRNGNYLLPEDLTMYAGLVRKICKEENVPYFDISGALDMNDYDRYLGPDNVHLNSEGYTEVFNMLKTFLLELYK